MGEAYKPIIVAHRGFHSEHPENSHAAFRAAWAGGVDWCECDVRLSADGHAFVLHDDTLDRTTTAAGPVATRGWRDLADVRLLAGDGRPPTERLPALQAIADFMPARCGLLVELKVPLPRG